MTGTSDICAGCSNNGPSLMAGSGPLTWDSCQPQDYGPLNYSSAHGVGRNLLDGEHCIPHEQVLSVVGDPSGARRSEGDTRKIRQVTGNGRLVSNNPQLSGNPRKRGSQVLASGSVAQTAGQDAGVDLSSERLVLLRRLGGTATSGSVQ